MGLISNWLLVNYVIFIFKNDSNSFFLINYCYVNTKVLDKKTSNISRRLTYANSIMSSFLVEKIKIPKIGKIIKYRRARD